MPMLGGRSETHRRLTLESPTSHFMHSGKLADDAISVRFRAGSAASIECYPSRPPPSGGNDSQ
jgi:hypothetical protein